MDKTKQDKISDTGTEPVQTDIRRSSSRYADKADASRPKSSSRYTDKADASMPKSSSRYTDKADAPKPKSSRRYADKADASRPKSSRRFADKVDDPGSKNSRRSADKADDPGSKSSRYSADKADDRGQRSSGRYTEEAKEARQIDTAPKMPEIEKADPDLNEITVKGSSRYADKAEESRPRTGSRYADKRTGANPAEKKVRKRKLTSGSRMIKNAETESFHGEVGALEEEKPEPIEIPDREETFEEIVEKVSEEIVEEASEEAAEEVSDKTAEETFEEIAEEASEKTAEEVSEETAGEVFGRIAGETSEEMAEEASEKMIGKVSEETAERSFDETAEEASDETVEGSFDETAEEASDETVEEVTEETAGEVSDESAEEASKEEASEETVGEVFGEMAGEATEETVGEVSDESAEEASEEEASEETAGEASEETAEEASEEMSGETAGEASDEDAMKRTGEGNKKRSARIIAAMLSPANRKKTAIGCVIAVFLIVYASVAVYYGKHFYPGVRVFGLDCSGRTVQEVKSQIREIIGDYKLEIQERESLQDYITAKQIHLEYEDKNGVEDLLHRQLSALWPITMVTRKNETVEVGTTYDRDLMDGVMEQLQCFQSENIIAPRNAYIDDDDEGYFIVPEEMGNMLDADKTKEALMNALDSGKEEISLDAENCYIPPEIYKDNPKLNETMEKKNSLLGAEITYDFADRQEVVDTSVIKTFIWEDSRGDYFIDDERILEYVRTLAEKYDTYGGRRAFYTTLGTTEYLEGGDYGWLMDQEATAQELIAAIDNKVVETKVPIYSCTAKSRAENDIGGTFVEICISAQEMWCYQNGELIVDTPVVTGNESNGHGTPCGGVWAVDGKMQNAVLVGQGYRAPVKYWIPFNGGVGIHDLQSRYYYGGSIYLTNGSHGCVNTPLDAVRQIYDIVEDGTPVVIYYG